MFDLALARDRVVRLAQQAVMGWRPLADGLPEGLGDMPDYGGSDALWFLMGKGPSGYRYECLDQMPHLLVAGTTGSGKSVFLNGLLSSLLVRHDPSTLLLGLVDPKRVELSMYKRLPHLGGRGVCSDIDSALGLMRWAVDEMERRLDLLERKEVKNLASYNALGYSLPRVVLVVDEFADLIMGSGKAEGLEFKLCITRLAQKARACGIHLVLATQKPIVKVVDSLLKGNIPARVAFRVTNEVESRVILDGKGAESLQGKGDMLFKSPVENKLERLRGVWISDDDVRRVVRGG